MLPVHQARSFQVMTPGYTDRFLRHADSLGITDVVNTSSISGTKEDATFKIIPGLADAACYSLESRNFPGHFLRHFNSRIRKDPRDGSALFDQDATFCAREALNGSGQVSLESRNLPGNYVRHRGGEVWLDPFQDTAGFRQDASWALATPWWRSSVALPANQYQSFQVVSSCCTNRSLRHQDGLGFTEVVNSTSPSILKQDATFRVVAGLADASCYSFESRNYPGQFLRHFNSRIRRDARDGSVLFDQDATFCARDGLSGSGVSLEAYNFPGRFIRHYNSEVWLTSGSGGNSWETSTGFAADASWSVIAPWGP